MFRRNSFWIIWMINRMAVDGCRDSVNLKAEPLTTLCFVRGWLSPSKIKNIKAVIKRYAPYNCFIFSFYSACSLTKVSVIQTLKCFAVACFVSCHFMYCVMDCIEICFFSAFCKVCFSCSCAVFGIDSHL